MNQPLPFDSGQLTRQLQLLRTSDGFVAAPLAQLEPSLDATGWGAAVLRLARIDPSTSPDSDSVLALAGSADVASVWSLYWAHNALVLSGKDLPDQLRETIRSRLTPAGYFQEDPSAPFDIASAVLTTWAAISTLKASAPVDEFDATRAWVTDQLRLCAGNEFVRLHLYEILEMATEDSTDSHIQLLSACESEVAMLPTATSAAANEEQLLHSFAIAEIGRLLPEITDDGSRSLLRQVLAPQPFMSADPWWSYYAMRGYLAAGGAPADYQTTITALAGNADPDGMLSNTPIPTSSLQQTYLAARIMNATGVSPTAVLDLDALAALVTQQGSNAWYDGDWAIWGETMYLVGSPLSAEMALKVREAAARCSDEEIVPANARAVGVCRTTLRHLGADVEPAEIEWSKWEGAPSVAVVDAAAALAINPPAALLRSAVSDLIAALETAPTSILADLLRIPEAGLTDEQVAVVESELSSRRASDPLDQLFVASRETQEPDLYSSAAVLLASVRR